MSTPPCRGLLDALPPLREPSLGRSPFFMKDDGILGQLILLRRTLVVMSGHHGGELLHSQWGGMLPLEHSLRSLLPASSFGEHRHGEPCASATVRLRPRRLLRGPTSFSALPGREAPAS